MTKRRLMHNFWCKEADAIWKSVQLRQAEALRFEMLSASGSWRIPVEDV
jgi:hypothetical protein